MSALYYEIATYGPDIVEKVQNTGDERRLTRESIEFLFGRLIHKFNLDQPNDPLIKRFISPDFYMEAFALDGSTETIEVH
jgi:hypothetical protein